MKRLGFRAYVIALAAAFFAVPLLAAPRLLTWGLDTGVSPANVCLYYTSASCFNIGTMSAGGAFTLPLGNMPAIPAETMIANATGATASPTAVLIPTSQPQGRLTLTSGVPLLAVSVTAGTTVYYSPYKGNQIPIPDGSGVGMVNAVFTELSQLTTDATKSPAAVTANSCYDVYVWNDAGTVRATRGAKWTSCLTRGASAAISRNSSGFLVNSVTVTNGPAASQGIKVGSISSNAGSTIDYIFGGPASGGVAARMEVCNDFNREPIVTQVVDSGASYTYSSATVRQARGSANMQASVMFCTATDSANVAYQTECATVATANDGCDTGLGFDSLTTFGTGRVRSLAPAASVFTSGQNIASIWQPGVGVHVLSANESSVGAVANTFNNAALGVLSLSIMH
jgi:hypothetical protein